MCKRKIMAVLGGVKVRGKSKRRFGRLLGWLMIVILIVIIVPIGAVMFAVSGLWSVLDRILIKFNK